MPWFEKPFFNENGILTSGNFATNCCKIGLGSLSYEWCLVLEDVLAGLSFIRLNRISS